MKDAFKNLCYYSESKQSDTGQLPEFCSSLNTIKVME